MAGSTISGKVTTTVTLGSASYPSPLTVTGSGDVAVSADSGIGIYGPAGSGTLINDGTVTGGAGAVGGGDGGTGVSLLGGSTATNSGTITGGAGDYSNEEGGGNGGVGVYLATGAALTNQAMITGGAGGRAAPGGPGDHASGTGGAGVRIDGGTVINSGAVAGGYGFGNYGFEGNSGAILLAGTLINTGTITGGSANFQVGWAGAGVTLAASGTLLNNGTIVGGYGLVGGSGISITASGSFAITGVVIGGAAHLSGGAGVLLGDGGSLDNTGTVTGGGGGGGGGGIGIYLVQGGTLTNAATIVGGAYLTDTTGGVNGDGQAGAGVSLANGGVVINAAFISGGSGAGITVGDGGDGVDLLRGGTVTNNANATITGGAGGYHNSSGMVGGGAGANLIGGTLTNAGTITGGTGASTGGGDGGTGVSLTAGAMVTNTGSIGGGFAGYDYFGGHGGTGVVMGSSSSASTVTNDGLITGGNDEEIQAGGTASLFFLAPIAGGAGVSVAAGDTLINNGTIVAGVGVYVGAGASVYIGAGNTFEGFGTFSGGDGAVVASGGTLINTGTIVSGVGVYLAAGGTLSTGDAISGGVYGGVTADAVLFAGAGTLAVDAGVSFVGQVVASATATDVLYLTPGSSTGTLSGIGTQFTNFAQITVGPDASWTLTGANTIATGTTLTELSGASLSDTGMLVNDGSIVLDPSTMTVAALIGTGPVAIDAGSTLEVQGTISGGETLVFGGSGAYLHLDSPDSVAGSITNFTSGESIDLSGINPATVSYTSGNLTFSGGDIALALASGGTVVASASTDGAEITVRLCFCANALILTPAGERPVQDLAVGDLVTTHRGEVRPIAWIGVGKVLATRGQRSAATPVIVRRGALAENVPSLDLRVTKGHAFLLDGVLIPVEFLVNHRLIEWDDRAQEVELYHVELASHDVLVANGAAAESYRDDGNRWLFRNANSGWDLPPQAPYAPVLTGGPVVDAVWRRLLRRAGPRPGFVLTDDPGLHLLVNGDRLDAAARHGTAYIFRLLARPASVRIVSRAAAPAELGLTRDPRVLGVAVRRIALRQGTRFRVVEAADAALREGFHPFEQVDGVRWTDGDAALPEACFKGFDGPMELVLHVSGATRYPLFGAADLPAAAA